MSLPKNTVREILPDQGPPQKQKIKYSGILVTINPNIRPSSLAEATALTQSLRRAVRVLLSDHNVRNIVDMMDGKAYNSKNILNITSDFSIELGTKSWGRRIHAHVYMQFEHLSMIRLNQWAIKKIISANMRDFNVTNPYINFKIIGSDKNLLQYLKKQGIKGWYKGAPPPPNTRKQFQRK